MPETYQLTDLQIAIIRVLWDRGQATVAEICEALREERGLAPTTIATLLTRLQKRGVVSHTTRQRQFVYRAEVTESEVQRSMVSDLTERLFDDSPALGPGSLLRRHGSNQAIDHRT